MKLSYESALRVINEANGKIFKVTCRRKHPKFEKIDGKKVKVAEKGEPHTMIFRTGVKKFTNEQLGLGPSGKDTAQEDAKCHVLTGFNMDLFNKLRREGNGKITAGKKSYRRINMDEILDIVQERRG